MINLWYEDSHFQGRMTGPEKLLNNLKESLQLSNIPYSINEDKFDKNFLVHYDAKGYEKHENLDHETCFIGPQFWPFDNWGQFLVSNPNYYNKLIVPSDWVKNLLVSKFNLSDDKVSVWPVGISESNLNRNVRYDCLIYYKRRSEKELDTVCNFLASKKLTYNIISYGNYVESDLELLTSQSRFCFLLNGTESQGIAVQEIMDQNVPLFVWDVKDWSDQGEEYKVDATSVPYWDDTCGERFFDESEMSDTFSRFYDRIDQYCPKDFISKNLSYEQSVQKLLEILNAN